MKVIKLTTPWPIVDDLSLQGNTSNSNFYYPQTPDGSGIVNEYKFEINNDCLECDYWVIWGGLNPGKLYQLANCPPDNIFFITDEAHYGRFFVKDFLKQFKCVLSCRTDLNIPNLIKTHELNLWHLSKDFNFLDSFDDYQKDKKVVIISSNLCDLDLHKKRFALTNILKGHFKDRIDVYGRGIKSFPDKWALLKDYKYSVAIENSVVPGYFTEKITECFLTNTVPIYYGCPNIGEYFDEDSFFSLDIDDYKTTIALIEKIIDEDPYSRMLESVKAQKKKVLYKYNIFAALTHLIPEIGTKASAKKRVKIYKEDYFKRGYYLRRMIQIFNNRSFISDRFKFSIMLLKDAEYANVPPPKNE